MTSEQIANRIDIASIKKQYPEILNAQDLEQVIELLGQHHPFLKLEARLVEDSWLLEGVLANVVTQVNLNVITSRLSEPLSAVKKRFVGHVDSVDSRVKILKDIRTTLTAQGFPNHAIDFRQSIAGYNTIYDLTIDEGAPCLVKIISTPFKIPAEIKSNLVPGDVCNLEQIAEAASDLEENLRDIGYLQAHLTLDDVKYSRNKTSCDVLFLGSLGQRIEYSIIDESKNFADEILNPDTYEGIDFSINDPEVMREEIEKFYRSNGYEDVQVSAPELRRKEKNKISYTYRVRPGVAYTVDVIQFEGNQFVSKEQLLDLLGLSNFWELAVPLNRDEINQGVDRIEAHYGQLGFWDVKIGSPRITKNSLSASAQIVLVIDEGRRRILNDIEFRGFEIMSEEELIEQIEFDRGDSISKSDIASMEENLRSLYLRQGYLYAKVFIDIDSTTLADKIQTNLVFRINEGIRVKVGTITTRGLVKTQPKVVQRELLFSQGDWYNPEIIDRTRKNLSRLGIFSSVQITAAELATQTAKPEVINLVLELQESRAGHVSFGPGYNIRRGFNYVAELNYKNIMGNNRQLSLRASLSQEKHQNAIGNSEDSTGKMFLGRKLGVGYVEPYMLDLPVSGNVSLSHLGVAETIWKISNTLELGLTHAFDLASRSNSATLFYNLKHSRDEGSRIQEDSLVTTGDSRIGSIGMRLSSDSRNSISWPSDGSLSYVELQLARFYLGGNYHYFKYELRHAVYFGLISDLVLAFSTNFTSFEEVLGRVEQSEIDVLPSTERLSAKGVEYVRGFQEELGPYAEVNGVKNAIGGTRRFVLKSELRYRISEMLGITGFLDSGNTFLSNREMRKFARHFATTEENPVVEGNVGYEFRELFYRPGFIFSRNYLSYGTSLNWLTPIGAVNASVAWPMREPITTRCEEQGSCFTRAKRRNRWYMRYQFDLSVGADF